MWPRRPEVSMAQRPSNVAQEARINLVHGPETNQGGPRGQK